MRTAKRLTILFIVALAAGFTALGCAGSPGQQAATDADHAMDEHAMDEHAGAGADAMDAAQAVVTDENGTRVTLEVTTAGFVPASVVVPAGKPVTLSVTRRTDKTCATELVMKGHDIDLKLPLDETVEVTFVPDEAGTLDYACAMDMIKGRIVVQ